jgi:hydrogenase nickel incorporation protein HypB
MHLCYDQPDGAHSRGPGQAGGAARRPVALGQDVLARNDALAGHNRAFFQRRSIAALNVASAPGSGKTTLLEVLLRRLPSHVPVAVIEGDQETERDAQRIRAAGVPAVQINTRARCHLDAEMIGDALRRLDPASGSLLFIENVGNLVCPALFDLGELRKVVVMSVTEGEDKPLKYPHLFRAADALVLAKTDLLPHLDFDLEGCLGHIRQINPHAELFRLSARDGTGVAAFADWVQAQVLVPPRSLP